MRAIDYRTIPDRTKLSKKKQEKLNLQESSKVELEEIHENGKTIFRVKGTPRENAGPHSQLGIQYGKSNYQNLAK